MRFITRGFDCVEHQPEPSASSCSSSAHPVRSLRGGADASSSAEAQPQAAAALRSSAARKISLYTNFRVVTIKGDGRCMFRALARGLARNAGSHLGSPGSNAETREADELRTACWEAMCRSDSRRMVFSEALPEIQMEGGLGRYCQRAAQPSFWGGESEMYIVSRMLRTPIHVFRTAAEVGIKQVQGFVPISSYGEEHEGRKPVNLLYQGGNHYNLLLS